MAKVLRKKKKRKKRLFWVTTSVLQITAAKTKNNEKEISFALYLFMQHGGLFLMDTEAKSARIIFSFMLVIQSMNSKRHWDSIESLKISRYFRRSIVRIKRNETKYTSNKKEMNTDFKKKRKRHAATTVPDSTADACSKWNRAFHFDNIEALKLWTQTSMTCMLNNSWFRYLNKRSHRSLISSQSQRNDNESNKNEKRK